MPPIVLCNLLLVLLHSSQLYNEVSFLFILYVLILPAGSMSRQRVGHSVVLGLNVGDQGENNSVDISRVCFSLQNILLVLEIRLSLLIPFNNCNLHFNECFLSPQYRLLDQFLTLLGLELLEIHPQLAQ